ncbi:MAG: matrixin family metalloprotease [Boseongicola sp.]
MSYSAGNFKWGAATLGSSSGEITWTSDITSGLNYNTSLYDQGDFDDALQDAFDRWENVAAIDFAYSTSSNVDVDVIMGSLDGNTVGLASFSYFNTSPLDTIFDASVTLDSNEFWAPYGGGALDFFSVALHEIGHVLGLGHVDDTSEIMNPFISTDVLGDGDISGVQFLYGSGGAEEPPVEDPPADPPVTPPEGDGGGSGGGAGAILGILAAIIALVFGGFGGAAAVVAAARAAPDDEAEDEVGEDDVFLTDLMPVVETHIDVLFDSEKSWLLADEEDHAEDYIF